MLRRLMHFRGIGHALRSRIRSAVALPKPETLRIERTTTSWVFISDSNDPRHLSDIVFGVHALSVRNVPKERVYVCTSHPNAAQYLNPYGIRDIHPIEHLDLVLTGLGCEILVLVVGGHGTVDGAGYGKRILKPAAVVSKTRGITGLRAGVIVLCQCFAGAFNLMDAEAYPPLVLIGGTNLNASLSATATLTSARRADGRPQSAIDGSWRVPRPPRPSTTRTTPLSRTSVSHVGAGPRQLGVSRPTCPSASTRPTAVTSTRSSAMASLPVRAVVTTLTGATNRRRHDAHLLVPRAAGMAR